MFIPFVFLAFWLSLTAYGQTQYPTCTRELLETDDCLAVIDANACYNKFRFRDKQTLTCIDGASDAEKAKKVCKCCSCVGTVMCDWATKQKLCSRT